MRVKILPFFLFAAGISFVDARIWTDVNGREIEADLVSADTDIATLKKAGKEFKFPVAKLSESDRAYVKEWMENDGDVADSAEDDDTKGAKKDSPTPPKPSPGSLQFDGQELKTGGHTNVYSYDYNAETVEMLKKKLKHDDTGYKLGIAVPNDFDPSKPQKVFVVSTAVNNEAEGRNGNLGKMGMYAKHAINKGWICISCDSNNGYPKNTTAIQWCFTKLNQVWPNCKTWQYATGGFSGGSKSCFGPCAYLLKNKYPTLGVFMAGCNEDASQGPRETYKNGKSDYKKLRIFLSTGDKDGLVNKEQTAGVIASLKSNGMRNIRSEVFDGGHSMNKEHFEQALDWFVMGDK